MSDTHFLVCSNGWKTNLLISTGKNLRITCAGSRKKIATDKAYISRAAAAFSSNWKTWPCSSYHLSLSILFPLFLVGRKKGWYRFFSAKESFGWTIKSNDSSFFSLTHSQRQKSNNSRRIAFILLISSPKPQGHKSEVQDASLSSLLISSLERARSPTESTVFA